MKEQVKRKVTIGFSTKGSHDSYLEYLNKYFDVKVVDIHNYSSLEKFPDFIVFTGGADVDPSIYNEKKGKYTKISKSRDKVEKDIYYDFKNVPKLGICRGSQFLTAMSGGKLIQHVENHAGEDHSITVESPKRYGITKRMITSTHHQMMYPFNLDEKEYDLIGWSTYFRSPLYLNGNNEQIECDKAFYESEIVYYKKSKSLCIQGHPEFKNCDSKTKDLCIELITEYLLDNKE